MIGKVIEIGKTSVVINLVVNDEQKRSVGNIVSKGSLPFHRKFLVIYSVSCIAMHIYIYIYFF